MKTYQKLAISLSLGLSLIGCGGVGSNATATKDLPIAVDDSATANLTQKKPTIIPVLANDTPLNKLDPTTIEIITPPDHGTTSIATTSGEIKYTPNTSYTGTDSFSYTVKDKNGNYSNPATVTITSTQTPFKITVRTSNFGVSDKNTFHIPIVGGPYDVDCDSDGISETKGVVGGYSCKYPNPGKYTISITGDIPHISFRDLTAPPAVGKDNLKLLSIDQWGTGQWGSMKNAFSKCSNMTLNATDNPNLTVVSDMSGMFAGAEKFNGDIGNWDVSSVTNMKGMFYGTKNFVGRNIGDWGEKVKNVTNMAGMFAHAESFNADIGNWNVSSVDNMELMFIKAISFEGINLGQWGNTVNRVSTMYDMFNGADKFNGDIGNWDVSSVENMAGMFSNTKSFIDGNIGLWRDKVKNVTDMSGMFSDTEKFNGDISSWNVSSVTRMNNMFKNAKNFHGINLGNWGHKISKVDKMEGMFSGAEKFDSDIGDWDVSAVTSMNAMFKNAINFRGINIGKWGDKVRNTSFMISMFEGAIDFDGKIGNWDVGKVGYMQDMFTGVTLLPDTYDSILVGWEKKSLNARSNNNTIWYKRFFNGGNSVPSITGSNARELLRNRELWNITDGDG